MKIRAAVLAVLLLVGCPECSPDPEREIQNPAVDCATGAVVLQERFEQDTTLHKGCYLAQKTPVIGDAVQLTLEPGVIIVFSEDVGLTFTGDQALVAAGTAEEPILLTGALQAPGYWKGVRFDGAQSPDTLLEYVTIEFGGSTKADPDAAALKVTGNSRLLHASIRNSTLQQSAGWGLWLDGSAVVEGFPNNKLAGNTLGPASVDSQAAGALDDSSLYSGGLGGIQVRANGLDHPDTWRVTSVPYYLDSSLHVSSELTIAAGATLIMKADTGITVSGDAAALIAMGTEEQPILFTCEKKQRGSWNGIRFDGSMNAKNELRYVTIEYGGSTASDRDNANVKLVADSHGVQLKMTHSRLIKSEGFGLFLAGSAAVPDFFGNVLTQNTLGPALVGSAAAHLLSASSTYIDNDVDAVSVDSRYSSPDVTWHAIGVPFVLRSFLQIQGVLTLEPGVTIALTDPAASITVSGPENALHAVGTAEKPIVITGAAKTPGSWGSINFDNTELEATNVLDYVTVEYGGGAGAQGLHGAIVARADSRGSKFAMTHSTVQHSAEYGVWLGGSADVGDLEAAELGNTFADNASGNVFREQ
jgi:hypothetical protein